MVEVRNGEEGGGMVVHVLCRDVRCVVFWYVFQYVLENVKGLTEYIHFSKICFKVNPCQR